MFDTIKCVLIEFTNMLIEHILNNILTMIATIVSFLPKIPISPEPMNWGPFGSAIGYVIPIGQMAQHFVLMLGLVAIWYSYEYIMRLIKMIK